MERDCLREQAMDNYIKMDPRMWTGPRQSPVAGSYEHGNGLQVPKTAINLLTSWMILQLLKDYPLRHWPVKTSLLPYYLETSYNKHVQNILQYHINIYKPPQKNLWLSIFQHSFTQSPTGFHLNSLIYLQNWFYLKNNYRISRTIRCNFFPEKCDLKSTCVLYAKGKYLFPNLRVSLHLLYDIFIVR